MRVLVGLIDGDFAGHAFELDPYFDWRMGEDEKGRTILVPLKKGEEA